MDYFDVFIMVLVYFSVFHLHHDYLVTTSQLSHILTNTFKEYKCKKNCCFITMCKAHSKVTHIKQQKYFHHLKCPGYNTDFLLYPRPFR